VWTVAATRARSRADWQNEELSDAFLRRREKYVAAVALSVAVSTALTRTVWDRADVIAYLK
jgi:cytochrome c2